jgi:hypothetical protein
VGKGLMDQLVPLANRAKLEFLTHVDGQFP